MNKDITLGRVFAAMLLGVLCASSLAAADAVLEGKSAAFAVRYNDTAAPGDAVVLRLKVSPAKGATKAQKAQDALEWTAELFDGKKRLEKTVFFPLPKTKTAERMAFIPLSTWMKEGGYTIRLAIKDKEEAIDAVQLPFTAVHKDFISETIPLDERNTAIKTDTSEKRMAQINRLNAILGTVTQADVFSTGPFVPPVAKDTRRSSHFGDRRVYKYTSGKSSTSEHFGIDYAVPKGTVVGACAEGKVVMAEDRVSTGWSVAVEHAPGLYSLYYHMESLSVKEGQMVKTGDKLGLSGATGLATGPHLHWEVRLNMCAVSPDFWTTVQ